MVKKGLLFNLLVIVIMLGIFIPTTAFAEGEPNIGTPIGSILATDIIAKINGYVIQSYNIDSSTVIYAKDLKNYGFEVTWDGEKRAVIIMRNSDLEITPMPLIDSQNGTIGEKLGDVLYTDIKTYLDNVEVKSFNINGSTAIYFRDMKQFGDVEWNQSDRISSLILKNSIEADVYYKSGLYYHKQGNARLAIQNLDKAISLNIDYLDIYMGYIDGSEYKNDYLGLKLELPENWYITDLNVLRMIIQYALEETDAADENIKAIQETALDTFINILVTKHDINTVDVESNANLLMVMNKIIDIPEVTNSEQYIEYILNTIKEEGIEYIIDENIYTETINNIEYKCIKVKTLFNDMEIHQKMYITIKDGFAVRFVISYMDDDQYNELVDIINTIQEQ